MFSHTKGTIDNGDTGDVACDSYHKFREDVQLLRDMQVNECLCLILYGRGTLLFKVHGGEQA